MRRSKQSASRFEQSSTVIGYLCHRMQTGDLPPGGRIPPESELATALRLRVKQVREGIACLSTLGVIRQDPGKGMIRAQDPPLLLLDLLKALYVAKPNEAAESRDLLYPLLAGLAAHRATEDDHTAMAEEVAELYAASDPRDSMEHVVRFHRRLARSAGNSLLAAFAESLPLAWLEERELHAETTPDLREVARRHREIYRAIRRHQSAEATRVMADRVHGSLQKLPCEPCPAENQNIACRMDT
jgi:GntR family transcriptional regulator, transcriptional repressor for pyruvate dehydrogenase complex